MYIILYYVYSGSINYYYYYYYTSEIAKKNYRRKDNSNVVSFEDTSMFGDHASLLLPKSKAYFMHKLESLLPTVLKLVMNVACLIVDDHVKIRTLPVQTEIGGTTFTAS